MFLPRTEYGWLRRLHSDRQPQDSIHLEVHRHFVGESCLHPICFLLVLKEQIS